MSQPVLKFKAEVMKHTITDLAKFLGGKAESINVSIDTKEVVLTQASPVSSAKVVLKKSMFEEFKVSGAFVTSIDPAWVKSSLSKASKNQMVTMSFTDTQCKIEWGRYKTNSATFGFDETASPIESDNAIVVPPDIIQFVRKYSAILRMKPYFSTRPLAATIGTVRKRPFLLVNDQYHGLLIVSPEKSKRDIEKFSMDAAAVSAMAFDPKSSETDQEKLKLTITEGRVILKFPNISYEIPAFEPSAVPSIEEIDQLVKMGRSGERSHNIELNSLAMAEAASFSRRGEDASQSFYLKYSNNCVRCVYTSSTVDSRCEVDARKKKWSGDILVDPNMIAEIVDQISHLNKSIFTRKEDKHDEDETQGEQMQLLMDKGNSVLMLTHGLAGHKGYPSAYGFVVTGG